MDKEKNIAGRSVLEILKRFDKKIRDPRSFNEGKKIVKIIRSFLKINCKLEKLNQNLSSFEKKNKLKKNIFKDYKSIKDLKKLKKEIKFNTNFGREIEYYTGLVFEVYAGKKNWLEGDGTIIY